MRTVERDSLLDYVTYEEQRAAIRQRILAIKARRRIHVGDELTFLFENAETIRYQVQEMMRAERIVREIDVQHELATYNELLGGPGELGCTLLIEIDDPAERDRKLVSWLALPAHVYARTEDGEKVRATYDVRQVGEGRLSSVQYLKFPVRGRVPVALGSDLPGAEVEAVLGEEQRAALGEDLTDESGDA